MIPQGQYGLTGGMVSASTNDTEELFHFNYSMLVFLHPEVLQGGSFTFIRWSFNTQYNKSPTLETDTYFISQSKNKSGILCCYPIAVLISVV